MPEIIQQKSLGCLRRIALFAVLPLLLTAAALIGGSLWLLDKFSPYLSSKPLPMPDFAVSEPEFQVLRGRIDAFHRSQVEGLPAELRLSDREIGALLLNHEDWVWGRNICYARIEGERLFFHLSLPISQIPLVGILGRGRYLNLIADICPRIYNGKFDPDLRQVWIGDRKATDGELSSMKAFIEKAIDNPPPFTGEIVRGSLRNLSEIFVKNGNLVVRCGGFGRRYDSLPLLPTPETAPVDPSSPARDGP